MSGLVGALLDAWSELRHHKLRVLLSLIGIAVSVGAISAVVALGEYQRQFAAEQSDRSGGRQATITVSALRTDGTPVDWRAFDERFDRVAERFSFTHVTHAVTSIMSDVQTPGQVHPVSTTLVDPAYASIHRSSLAEGRWFRDADVDLMAPAVVISEPLWEVFGSPSIAEIPTIVLGGPAGGVYQVIGVSPRTSEWDTEKNLTLLYDSYLSRVDVLPAEAQVAYEIWVPPAIVAELGPVLAMDLRAGLDKETTVHVNRTDWGSRPEAAGGAAVFELVTGAIAGLVLLLGGLGLVNIQLVAMRQRIREIGIRRSFGATAGRIFTSVLLESVVATAAAGIVGIALAVAILRTPLVLTMFPGMQDIPPFPLHAAVIGLAASVAIGALAGFIPALAAVRAKVIDALRF